MSDYQYPVAPPPPIESVPEGPGLTQMQRVTYTFTAPSKTFTDIKRSASWWMPFLITIIAGAFLYVAITERVTWAQVYENGQQNAPQFAKNMRDKMPPDQRAQQDKVGPITQAITWALSPLGLLLLDVIAAGVLLGTINFGFGGKATFGGLLAVTMYAGLVSWVIKFLLGGIAVFAGVAPESFNVQNVAGTNIGYYLNPQETPKALYYLAVALDPLVIWNLALTAIGVSIVAGTKRSSGYIAVFGWWALITLIFVGLAAM